MTMTFSRPTGAHRDVQELEFVTALLQTEKLMRTTISTKDLSIYLASRHGIRVESSELDGLRDLAGEIKKKDIDDAESLKNPPDATTISVLQLAAMLLIPELVDSEKNGNLEKYSVILERVLRQNGEVESAPFTSENLRRLFFHLTGQTSVDQSLIDEMVAVSDGSLGKALTDDIKAYDPNWRGQWSTHYHDALSATQPEFKSSEDGSQANIANAMEPESKGDPKVTQKIQSNPLKRMYTAPSIDFAADTFKSPLFVMCLWILGISLYFTYVYNVDEGDWNALDCDDTNLSDVGCIISKGVLVWLAIFIQISTLGTFYVFAVSLGNSVFLQSRKVAVGTLLCSMFVIGLLAYGGYSASIKNNFFNTEFEEGSIYALTAVVSLIVASTMLFTQCFDLLYLVIPTKVIERFRVLNALATPATLKAESKTKESSHWKIHQLAANALKYHEPVVDGVDGDKQMKPSAVHSFATVEKVSDKNHTMDAMVRYQLDEGQSETVGGVVWAWKKIFNGSLRSEEGVWLHGRLLACNFAQLFNIILIAGIAALLFLTADEFVYGTPKTTSKTLAEEPNAQILAYPDSVASNNITRIQAMAEIFDLAQNVSISPLYLSGFATLLYELSPTDSLPTSLEEGLVDLVTESSAYQFGSSQLTILSHGLHKFYFTVLDPPFDRAVAISNLDTVDEALDLGISERVAIRRGIDRAERSGEFDLVQSYGIDRTDVDNKRSALSIFLNLNMPQYLAVISMYVITAFSVALYIAALYVPSYISTVMKFRSGVISSLRDPYFEIYRKSLDVVTILFGSAFWGTLFASLVAGFIIAGLVLLLIKTWGTSLTRTIAGQAVGFGVIMVIKTAILMVMRLTFFSAFFRKKPAGANVFHVVMEVWNVALAVGFVAARAGMFVVCSALFIARIDTPFLAPGVGRIMGVELDSYPVSFRKDLLMHESHRHPYIERLGMLIMLKLRFPTFGRNPHACWRLLFTLALCPWLAKYLRPENEDDEVSEASDAEQGPSETMNLEGVEKQKTHPLESQLARLQEENTELRQQVESLQRA